MRLPFCARQNDSLAGAIRDVTYSTSGRQPLRLDIYPPTAARKRQAPLILYIHGGGWVIGSKFSSVRSVPGLRRLIGKLRRRGYLFVALDYRMILTHAWPAPLQDIVAALAYLRANAALYNLDPSRVGLLGDSAGGHLAALVALNGMAGEIGAVVDLFGPSDLSYLSRIPGLAPLLPHLLRSERRLTADLLRAASPISHISPESPPFLIVQGERDPLVPPAQARTLYRLLSEAGVAAHLIMVENATHALLPLGWPLRPSLREIGREIAAFYDRHLR